MDAVRSRADALSVLLLTPHCLSHDHATAQADVLVVDHHGLPRRHSPLRFGEADTATPGLQAFDHAGGIGLPVTRLGRVSPMQLRGLAGNPGKLVGT